LIPSNSLSKNKKGQVGIYIVFIISSIIIVMIAAFAAPMGVLFNTEIYKAGEKIMLQANESVQEIQNATVRASIEGIINDGLNNVETNIEVNGALFQYGWILVVGLTALILFLLTRSIVEVRTGNLI
jgi:hypothetical protein